MPKSGEYSGGQYENAKDQGDWDPGFCNAYGKCGDDCLMFGCAFEEAEDMRNWEPSDPETDED